MTSTGRAASCRDVDERMSVWNSIASFYDPDKNVIVLGQVLHS